MTANKAGKMKNKTKIFSLEKIPTGIRGFDDTFAGGVPQGRVMLILGGAGTGKTVLLNEFLYRGITQFKQNGVFVTFEEEAKDIIENVASFGWNYKALISQKKLAFVQATSEREAINEIGQNYDLSPLIERIRYAVKKVKAKRLAFDGIDSLFSRFQNKEVVRQALRQIIADLRNMGVTVFMSSEKPDSEEASGRYTIEEFVADGVIDLALIKGQQRFLRRMFVLKIRGADFRSGIIDFSITSQGLEFYPKIPDDRRIAKTNFEVRKKYGIPALDAMLGGGLPQGHMVLVSGNTGTGKTIFSLQFLVQGIREGENAVFVTLEEPVAQLKKMARSHGWNLDRYQEEGKLTFITADPMDVSTDKLLHEIVCAVDRTKAKRVVVDSISTLHSATLNEEQVRQFMIQLSGFLKARGVTGIFNYLFQPSFGASRGQLLSGLITNEMRLSSIIDGIVMLLYVERGQRIKKLLTVLKMRGIRHSRDIFNYEIETGGIKMGEKYEE